MSQEKILTISVAAYNVESYIAENLDSILITDVRDEIEVLVVDDGGNDEILRWKNNCTVLEMLIAAAIQMEKIMDDPDIDYSARHWFWMFLENLDLADMTDDVYDKTYIYGRVSMFMDRTYDPDGDGNIIYIPNIREDLRDIEIWCQMCWYMDSIL